MVVTHEGGVRFAADVRGHRVIVDQPIGSGGEDSGPHRRSVSGVFDSYLRTEASERATH